MDSNRDVIQIIDKLRAFEVSTGCSISLNLPEIVVVGAQSSGKSSVLDGIIGASILPRGKGTVTKCPIIVQLTTTKDPELQGIEFKEDASEEGKVQRIKDYDTVRERINAKMNENDGAITDTPITISVFSSKVVDLTVVDLPGIKRLTSSGEPNDLELQIANLSRKYINQENSIILAVSPANYEITNSDGLILAKEADPEGKRTLGVLTKLDLMDEGTDARDVLTGKLEESKLKLGMIGIVNRSQKDVEENMSIEDQLKKEEQFLKRTYPDLAGENGVPYLRKMLHELLVKHINKCLPGLLDKLEVRLEECEKFLDSIPNVGNPEDKKEFVGSAVCRFADNMKTEIEGSMRRPVSDHLFGGIKIKDDFEKKFFRDMDTSGKESTKAITDKMIINLYRNSGSYDSFFAQPEAVFRTLAQSQLANLQEPALKCAKRIYSEILDTARRCLKNDKELDQFPELRNAMKSVVTKMMDGRMDTLKDFIHDYIEIQSDSVFTLDSELRKKLEALRSKLEDQLKGKDDSHSSARLSEALKKPDTIKTIKEMVQLYFNHVKSHILDFVPKVISKRIIEIFSGRGSLSAIMHAHVSSKFEELAKLPDQVEEKRKYTEKLKETMKEVIAEVNGILEQGEDDNDDELEDDDDYIEEEGGDPNGN